MDSATRLTVIKKALGNQGWTLAQVNKELQHMLDVPSDFDIMTCGEEVFKRLPDRIKFMKDLKDKGNG